MKAIAITEPGASPALVDLPAPGPAEGEVLVRARASSVNGFDLSVAHGRLIGMMEHRYPVVLGKDFAGTVEAVGAGVDGFAAGDTVFGVVMKPYLGDGALGELVTTPAAFLARVPAEVDLVVAGVLGLAGTAAADAVGAIDPSQGETVLVAGATGGVGAIAIQLLRARGATVIATAATEDERAFVTGLGAHSTVDHSSDLAAALRSVQPDGVDAALHLAGDGGALAGLLRRGGRMASTLGFSADQTDRDDVTVTPIMANPSTATLQKLSAAVGDGTVQVPVQRTYHLADAPQAFSDFAAGTLGKLAITIN